MLLIQVQYFGLAQNMALEFYTSVTKRVETKSQKFLQLIPKFVEVTKEKLAER